MEDGRGDGGEGGFNAISRKKMKKIICLIIISAILSGPLFAVENAGDFLRMGSSARITSLGGQGVAMVQNSESVYWNPALLTKCDSNEFSATIFNGFEAHFYNCYLTFPNAFGNQMPLGLGLLASNMNEIPENISNPNIPGRYTPSGYLFEDAKYALLISSGFLLNPELAIGLTGKVIYENYYHNSAVGFGADMAMVYQLSSDSQMGCLIQNIIQPDMKWTTNNTQETIPTEVKIGIAHQIIQKELFINTDVGFRMHRPTKLSVGLEYFFLPELQLRMGFITDSEKIKDIGSQIQKLENLSVGMGLILNQLTCDFSWINQDLEEIDDIYRLTLSYKF